jgi:hypothetical protein
MERNKKAIVKEKDVAVNKAVACRVTTKGM